MKLEFMEFLGHFGPKTHTKEGQKSLFSKKLQNGLKSSKMVQNINIAQLYPDFNGIHPVLWPSQDFEKIEISGIFKAILGPKHTQKRVKNHHF